MLSEVLPNEEGYFAAFGVKADIERLEICIKVIESWGEVLRIEIAKCSDIRGMRGCKILCTKNTLKKAHKVRGEELI